jgi:tRNA-(ms[2]io[6]A)-hydroxylase
VIALAPSSEAWLAAALGDLPTLLCDHAHCEKKAASTAVRFLFKYPDWPRLCAQMSRLAREELIHFDRVLAEMRARQIPFRQLPSSGYAAALFASARPEPQARRIDELLACALIEARSHERFERLVAGLAGASDEESARLGEFYRDLAEAEARHGDIYIELAEELAGGPVSERLVELAACEAAIIARPGQPLRMHSG